MLMIGDLLHTYMDHSASKVETITLGSQMHQTPPTFDDLTPQVEGEALVKMIWMDELVQELLKRGRESEDGLTRVDPAFKLPTGFPCLMCQKPTGLG